MPQIMAGIPDPPLWRAKSSGVHRHRHNAHTYTRARGGCHGEER